MSLDSTNTKSRWIERLRNRFHGSPEENSQASKLTLAGLSASAAFLFIIAAWLFLIQGLFHWYTLPIFGLFLFGFVILVQLFQGKISLRRANQLALFGQLTALFTFYFVSTRFVNLVYVTDSIVGSYLGVIKTLQLQNPYLFSIKPLLEQFGLPPSLYTPRMDGSFEFHLNYPALNFLTLIPLYLLGDHDLRDGVLLFHILSIFIVYLITPPKYRSMSILAFILVSPALIFSWTESIWVFFLILSAYAWTRNRNASFVALGLATAVKQIAIVILPFLLIRQWHENGGQTGSKANMLKLVGITIGGFLVSNLPFMIISPVAWWQGTVAPYIPGSPALLPGGIGISGMMIDLGVALPSWIYAITTGTAFAILLYYYIVRFDRLNKWTWILPMFGFFFYYRSLPNYLIYWSFPLIVELGQWGRLAIIKPRALPHFSIPLYLISEKLSGVISRRFLPFLLSSIIVIGAIVGVSGAYVTQHQTTSPIQILVNTQYDPDNLGAATGLNVTLHNQSSKPIMPVFFVKWNWLANVWITGNGPEIVNAKSDGSYFLQATDALAAIPRGDTFRLVVSDKITQDLVAESDPIMVQTQFTPVVNPLFKWWTINEVSGTKVPYGWTLTTVNNDLYNSGIQPLTDNDPNGVFLRLNYTSIKKGSSEIDLSQQLLFNSTMSLNVHVNDMLTTNLATDTMFGASVTANGHVLYYVFSETVTVPKTMVFADNTTIIMPITHLQWNTVQLHVQSDWAKQRWGTPYQVTFALFVRATSTGIFYAGISQVNTLS